MPSIRELAISEEVNPNTVTRNYAWLQNLGIIYNRRGLGCFVDDAGFERTRQLKMAEFVENDIPAFSEPMELLRSEINDLESPLRTHRK